MNGVGIFFIILLVLLVCAMVGWVVFTQLRARRLGLPPPPLSSYNPFARTEPSYGGPSASGGGIRGWINDKLRRKNNNTRSAAGAYESTSSYNAGRRGFGPLDPDEAWDTRVGNEANAYGAEGYYEEQELGGGAAHGNPYGGHDQYPMNLGGAPGRLSVHDDDDHAYGHEERRGRSREREGDLGVPNSERSVNQANPFDDDAALGKIDTTKTAHGVDSGQGPFSDSPSERRSMFREEV